jgi:predicted nucleic acid-binding protein
LDGCAAGRISIASLTIAEIWRGVQETPARRRRNQLETWFAGAAGPPALFAGRILSFDERAALIWGRLMADGKAKGRPRSALDTIVAAVAQVHGCIVVTDNEKDFGGIQTIDPMRS